MTVSCQLILHLGRILKVYKCVLNISPQSFQYFILFLAIRTEVTSL